MATDLTIVLMNRPGTLAEAAESLGGAGINIDGTCGFPSGGEGIMHVLVEDAEGARAAIERAGLEVRSKREVVVLDRLPERPGSLGEALRRIASAGVNVDLLYLTTDGRVVLSGEDFAALQGAIAE